MNTTGGIAMKKSRIIWFLFIIVAIIAMIKTASFMQGFGFALSVVIIIYSLMCLIGALYLIYTCYEKIKDKDITGAIHDIVLILVLAFLGIKILKWLIGILL